MQPQAAKAGLVQCGRLVDEIFIVYVGHSASAAAAAASSTAVLGGGGKLHRTAV